MTENTQDAQREQRRPHTLRASRMLPTLFLWLLIAITLGYLARGLLDVGPGEPPEISYSEFRGQLDSGNVRRVTVKGERIEGELEQPMRRVSASGDTATHETFVTYLPSFGDDELLSLLQAEGVEVEAQPQEDSSWWPLVLTGLLPFLLLLGIGFVLMRQMQARGRTLFSVGKSRAKLYDRRREKTSFDNVAGAQSAKAELREIIEFLRDPDRFQALGGKVPTGVLLVGPPGTGKTLLARAVAGEAAVPFLSITGSDFMEMFVGVGASRVRDLFNQAKQAAPSIIFIDELDSIGRHRGAGLGGGHDEREQTLNQLLSELDGFEPNENVIVMAATNRPDILDPALMRPGRFDRRVTVELPTAQEREQIFELHARDKPLAPDVDLEDLARSTPGLSGADLNNLLNEAALAAARADRKAIGRRDVEEARDKIIMGLKRKGVALSGDDLKLLAYHESGHAILAALLPNTDPIHKVTIVPRGRVIGVTQQLPDQERYIYKRDYMLDRITVMMGGRAAEELVLDTATSGAEADLKQATELARKMVLDWGMSEKLGPVAEGGERDQVFLGQEIAQRRKYSEMTAREIDEEVKRIVEDAYDRAVRTLEENREQLDRLAEVLLEREELSGEDVMSMLES